jgi:hypothetical protein
MCYKQYQYFLNDMVLFKHFFSYLSENIHFVLSHSWANFRKLCNYDNMIFHQHHHRSHEPCRTLDKKVYKIYPDIGMFLQHCMPLQHIQIDFMQQIANRRVTNLAFVSRLIFSMCYLTESAKFQFCLFGRF